MRVGFVGAGRMGWPMVERLHGAGHRVTVLGRSEAARERVAEAGARPAATVAEACAEAELVVVCVFSDEQVSEVCLEAEGVVASAPAGSTVVIHTTGSPMTAEAIARAGADRQLAVLDAPVSGGPHDIAAGAIMLMVGGPAEVLERVRPALSTYGSPIIHAGALGYGQRVKLANNALFAANLAVAADAVRLGEELGLSDEVLFAALTRGSGGRSAIEMLSRAGSIDRLGASIGAFLGKDVHVVQSVAERLGADLGTVGSVLDAEYVRSRLLTDAGAVG